MGSKQVSSHLSRQLLLRLHVLAFYGQLFVQVGLRPGSSQVTVADKKNSWGKWPDWKTVVPALAPIRACIKEKLDWQTDSLRT